MGKTSPKWLGLAGSRLWCSVVDDFELSGPEVTLLVQACQTADTCAALQAVIAVEGPMSETAEGTPRAHPALVELRQQRLTLARLMVALRLPTGEEDDEPQAGARTQRRGLRGVYGGSRET